MLPDDPVLVIIKNLEKNQENRQNNTIIFKKHKFFTKIDANSVKNLFCGKQSLSGEFQSSRVKNY